MKKLIFGSVLFVTGILSSTILLSGAMAQHFTTVSDGGTYVYSALRILNDYGLLRVLVLFMGMAVVGLAIAVMGMRGKD